MGRLEELIKPFQDIQSTPWQIRLEIIKALIDLEAHKNGLNGALSSVVKFIIDESSLQVQTKAAMHFLHLCQMQQKLGNRINNPCRPICDSFWCRKAENAYDLRKSHDVEMLEEQKEKLGSMKIWLSRCQETNVDQVRVSSEALNSLEAVKEMDTTVSGGLTHILAISVKWKNVSPEIWGAIAKWHTRFDCLYLQ